MIVIVDYNTGNLCSVINAMNRIGAQCVVTNNPQQIIAADKVILPGVGAANVAMDNLRKSGLVDVVVSLNQPVLGICVGMQLMCQGSSEGDTACLGIFDTYVSKFDQQQVKVPHVGWNSIENLKTPLFEGVDNGSFVYYVHSFRADTCSQTIAQTTYQTPFSGALSRDNFYGVQFHPEKSGSVGEKILCNFLNL